MTLAQRIVQFNSPIYAISSSCDGKSLAVSPNSNDIEVYTAATDTGGDDAQTQWQKTATLKGHDHLVSSLDWSHREGLLVSCSEDRNAYVWRARPCAANQPEASTSGCSSGPHSMWDKELVMTRLNRAALCVRWSPNQTKFAIGSGARCVSVCHYQQDMRWWSAKLIKKPLSSSVVSVSWHPSSHMVATASTEGLCRVFSAYIEGVDILSEGTRPTAPFGQLLWAVDPADGWVHSVAWSPSGLDLMCCTHGGSLHFSPTHTAPAAMQRALANLGWSQSGGDVDIGAQARELDAAPGSAQAEQPPAESVDVGGLPLKVLLAVSEHMVVGGGWDGLLRVLSRPARGARWRLTHVLGLDSSIPLALAPEPPPVAATATKLGWLTLQQSDGDDVTRMDDTHSGSTCTPCSAPSAPTGLTVLTPLKCLAHSMQDLEQQWEGLSPAHSACVTGLHAATADEPAAFTSTGLDGRLLYWSLAALPTSTSGC